VRERERQRSEEGEKERERGRDLYFDSREEDFIDCELLAFRAVLIAPEMPCAGACSVSICNFVPVKQVN
jgi:hypothetical protein